MEIWLPVIEYEDLYHVSNFGRVKSVYYHPGLVLKPYLGGHHPSVALCKDGVAKTISIHKLVLDAFDGLCPPGLECCHGNGNPQDNRRENLRWDTRNANVFDQVEHGVHANARKTHCKYKHEFTEQNTRLSRHGSRVCLTCERDRGQRRKKGKSDSCPSGHEYTPENTLYEKGKWRRCRICRANRAGRRKA